MTPGRPWGLFLMALVWLTATPAKAVCVAQDAFRLVLTSEQLGAATRRELTTQLESGLAGRGFELCTTNTELANVITIADDRRGTLDLRVRYAGIERARSVSAPTGDPVASGLAIAMAIEDLTLATAGPRALPPKPLPPEPDWRLGVELVMTTFAKTRVGFGGGLRASRKLTPWLRLDETLGVRRIESEAVTEGRARYTWIDAQTWAAFTLWRTRRFTLAAGPALAPQLIFSSGQARSPFAGSSATDIGLAGRAVVEGLVRFSSQSFGLRASFGCSLVGARGTTESNRELGGLTSWEATLGFTWLWSLP